MMHINIWVEVQYIHGAKWKGKLIDLAENAAHVFEPKKCEVVTVPLRNFSIVSIPPEDGA